MHQISNVYTINVLETPTDICELAFTTRYVATYLFLRVKCARPMTFQYITLTNGRSGNIDQTEFKTAAAYTYDTLIISEEVIKVLECYIFHVRLLLNQAM